MPEAQTKQSRRLTAMDCYHAGVRALAANGLEDAARALRMAVALDPRLAAAWNDLGILMEALGKPTDAVRCYQLALKARPDAAEPRENLCMLLLQLDLAKAILRQPFTSNAAC